MNGNFVTDRDRQIDSHTYTKNSFFYKIKIYAM